MTGWTPNLKGRRGPAYLALANAIAEAIEAGDLTPGERLPPRRELASAIGVSVNTVSSAYVEAERRGHVVGEVGRGTFVRRRTEESFIGSGQDELIDLSICRPAILPDQMTVVREALQEEAEVPDLPGMLSCRPVIGLPAHRWAGARWLQRLGVPAEADDVVIVNGATHGLLVALSAITEPDDLVVTEGLTDHGIISMANFLRFRLKGLACDRQGILPDAFAAAAAKGGIKALVVTPNLNNPTCSMMPVERRKALADIAHHHGIAIIEDDVFGPLIEETPPPLSSFYPENSYYVTSLTKCTVSGMRVGYLVGPSRDTQRLVARVRTTSWMATPLMAELATRWIEQGTIEDMVAGQRREIAARQALVDEYLAGFDYVNHPNGINVWINMPEAWRADAFVRQMGVRGVVVTAAEPFMVGRGMAPHAVRLSVGGAETRGHLTQALEIMREELSQRPEPAFIDL